MNIICTLLLQTAIRGLNCVGWDSPVFVYLVLPITTFVRLLTEAFPFLFVKFPQLRATTSRICISGWRWGSTHYWDLEYVYPRMEARLHTLLRSGMCISEHGGKASHISELWDLYIREWRQGCTHYWGRECVYQSMEVRLHTLLSSGICISEDGGKAPHITE
jgi:hypothetical protein